jgi:hypothetical protein
MAADYAERTSVVVYRSVAGILAGLAITALGFSVFFADGGLQRPTATPPSAGRPPPSCSSA